MGTNMTGVRRSVVRGRRVSFKFQVSSVQDEAETEVLTADGRRWWVERLKAEGEFQVFSFQCEVETEVLTADEH